MSRPATIPPELLSYITRYGDNGCFSRCSFSSEPHCLLAHSILVDELEEWKADRDAGATNRMDKKQRQKMPRHPLLTATRVNKHWVRLSLTDAVAGPWLNTT